MKTEFWACGKTKHAFVKEAVDFYLKRIANPKGFIYHELEIKKTNSSQELLIAEEEAISKLLKSNDFLILLDEQGEAFSSTSFASFLNSLNLQGRIIFLAGGAYGFSENIYKKAAKKISFSKMTFTHELIRIIFLEQYYRALTIIKNHPYHH